LPDSSIVWLNAGSRIEYPEKFDNEVRTIKLSGEAYFDVSHEEERKFVVKTGDITVNVLGTQFIVINYPNEKQAEVVLVSGKVHVNEADMENSEFKLSPGERFTLNKTTGKRIIEKMNTLSYTNWTEGKISFENAELKHIIKNLERWYGVSIICPENIGTRYNLTFTLRNEELEATMQMMSDIAPIRFEKTVEGIIVVNNK
jgi:ferric-dicitrate binding protein FerR (iron transport regulator)